MDDTSNDNLISTSNSLQASDNSATDVSTPQEDAPVLDNDPPSPGASDGQGNNSEQGVLSEETKSVEIASPAIDVGARNDLPTPEASAGQGDKKSLMAGLLQKFKEKMFARTQARLQKIMDLVNKKKKIKVADVRSLLIVSRPTATRYLDQLVKDGKLKIVGKSVETEYELV